MTDSSAGYHEPYDEISRQTRDMHRAIVSLMEELEAVDWYQQRADVCGDDALRAILEHNRDEEIEHAMMVLEWIRRRNPIFDDHMRTYLFTTDDVVSLEEAAPKGSSSGRHVSSDLGIGSLREAA